MKGLMMSSLIMLSGIQVCAQTTWVDRLEETAMPLSADYSGAGWDWLIEQGQEADYFLIGEAHGVAEIPQLSKALFEALAPAGYTHAAIETGPVTADVLNGLASALSSEPVEAFMQKHPFAIPFYGMREEFAFLQAVHQHSTATMPLVGLDQEFVLSPQVLLGLYADDFTEPDLLRAEQGKAIAGYEALVAEQDFEAIWLFAQSPEYLVSLQDKATTPRSQQVLEELALSQHIYMLNNMGKYHQNNLQRSQLMKDHFWEFRRANPEGKMMIKLGAYHAMRGYNYTNVQDIGNAVSEIPGSTSFHVAVLPMGGAQNMYLPFGSEEDKAQPIDTEWNQVFAEGVKRLLPESGYVILHTAALRPYMSQLPEDPSLRKLIQGYDAVILIPEATPSTSFQ